MSDQLHASSHVTDGSTLPPDDTTQSRKASDLSARLEFAVIDGNFSIPAKSS